MGQQTSVNKPFRLISRAASSPLESPHTQRKKMYYHLNRRDIHQRPPPSLLLTHEVGDCLAHSGAKDEVLQDVGNEGKGHAEDGHHQVADRQRQQEGVGDGAHALVHGQHDDDEQIAKHAQQEDEDVEQNAEGVHLCGERGKERARKGSEFLIGARRGAADQFMA